MATVIYEVRNVVAEFDATFSKFQDRLSDESDPQVVALADGGFAVAYRWESLEESLDTVLVDFYNADGTRRFGEDWTQAETEITGALVNDLSATQLANGALLVSWLDGDDPGIHYATIDPTSGRVLDEDRRLANTSLQDTSGRVAALSDNGFALVKRNFSSSTDLDSDLLIYNRDGVQQGGVHALNDNSSVNEITPALAVLTAGANKGAIVTAYAFEKVDGSFDYGMKVEMWNVAGQPVLSPFGFDTVGDSNVAPKVVALQDGGFAVAYLDDEYGVTSSMTIAFFDQNGNFRGKVRGDQDSVPDSDISLTVLQNGYVLLTHSDDPVNSPNIRASLFDPAAMTRIMVLGTIEVQEGTQTDSSVATLKNGTFATAWYDSNADITDGNTDPGDSHVSIQVDRIVRFSVGGNTIDMLTGDILVDQMSGHESGDTLRGMAGNDILNGDAGGDTLDGGTGTDTLVGGLDSDTYIVDNSGDIVVEDAGGGILDVVKTSVSYVLPVLAQVEQLTTTASTGTKAIELTGNARSQEIVGNAGANVLDDGGKGAADVLRGLGGNDIYRVNNAADVIEETASQGAADIVNASVSYVLGAGVHIETLRTNSGAATTAINLTGNGLKQAITGNAGANLLNSGAAGASDTLRGLGGSDTYRVHNTGDTIVEAAGQGTDKAITSISYALGTGVSVEVLQTNLSAGTSAINLYGNEIAQEIIGNNGANRIDGKGGADTLRGLGGADTFVFATKLGGGNTDTIVDFNPTNDRLQLSDTIFTALSPGTIAADQFRANTTGEARDSTDRIIYDTDSGGIFYDADGLGGAAGVRFAIVSTGLSITNADFDVV